jgi:MFS family permease
MSFQMLAVAVGWQMYAITGSAFALGLVGLAQFLPMLLLTPIVGHVADRYDRRAIVCVCQGITAAGATMFTIGSFEGWLSRDAMFVIVAALGAARAFESPATSALLPAVVPREGLRQASAASSAASQSAQILGPALGGILYAFVSPAAVYACVAAISLCGVALSAAIRMEGQAPRVKPTGFASLFAGMVFVARTPVILGTLSLDLVAVLLGGATALLPIFAETVLHAGPWGLGLLRSAPAIGALSASLLLARRPMRTHAGFTMLAGVGVFGVATIVFGLSHSLLLSLLALAILGAADTVSVVVRQTLVQLRTPPEMLGRVSAVNSLFIGCSNQLGEFESGTTAALFGAVPAVLIGGIGTVLAAVLWAQLFPALRELRTLELPHDPIPATAEADDAGATEGPR